MRLWAFAITFALLEWKNEWKTVFTFAIVKW